MFKQLTRGAAYVDDWLDRHLGRPYAIILSIGLVGEIGRRIAELLEHRPNVSHVVALAWLLALNGALLVHQLASLHHVRERRLRRTPGARDGENPALVPAPAAHPGSLAPLDHTPSLSDGDPRDSAAQAP